MTYGGGENAYTLSGDGRLLAKVGRRDNDVKLVDASKNSHHAHIGVASNEGIDCLRTDNELGVCSLSYDGGLLAAALGDHVYVWNTETNKRLHKLDIETFVTACCLSNDGCLLATGGEDGKARLWDTSGEQTYDSLSDKEKDAGTTESLRMLSGHKGKVTACSFSADCKLLATASNDKMVWLWDVSTAQIARCVRKLSGHADSVFDCSLSPDGRLLLASAGGEDQTVRLWNTKNGQLLAQYLVSGDVVTAVRCSSLGQVFAGLGSSGVLFLRYDELTTTNMSLGS